MSATAKKTRVISTEHKDGESVITFLAENGGVQPTVTITHSKIDPSLLGVLAAIGIISISRNAYGDEETPGARAAAVEGLLDRMYDGTYKPGTREGGEAQTPAIILAIQAVLTKEKGDNAPSLEAITAKYDGMSKPEKMKLAKRADILAARTKIEAERTKARVAAAKKETATPLDF